MRKCPQFEFSGPVVMIEQICNAVVAVRIQTAHFQHSLEQGGGGGGDYFPMGKTVPLL